MTRRDRVASTFEQCFDGKPILWARAPGRVDLMGSHTDYNLGFVLTLPISRDTWIAARPRADHRVRIWSTSIGAGDTFSLQAIEANPHAPWSNYIRGVASVLADEGFRLAGFDGVIDSTVPIGSGLSSSAALECVTASVFQAFGGWAISPARIALLCQRAENEFVGVHCGILDQYSSCLGEKGCALLLDCRDLTTQPVPVHESIRVVICDTRSKRELAGSEYGARRRQCEQGAAMLGASALRDVALAQLAALPPGIDKRCRFIVEENQRVLALAKTLPVGDRRSIRELTAASFEGARDGYEIVSPAMIAMMNAMLAAPGVIGARQAGAGFGGCMVAFVEVNRTDEFADAVIASYGQPAEVYTVDAAAGAGLLCFPN